MMPTYKITKHLYWPGYNHSRQQSSIILVLDQGSNYVKRSADVKELMGDRSPPWSGYFQGSPHKGSEYKAPRDCKLWTCRSTM